ncbi:hypothetical protein [Prosthecomicrobium pneumaticum]|uniref:Uncharacterized protein n=1 Tax=Prosthecomicrobium pneumaticum TaxID=81895 RepID=A0A7W9FP72_9HYPH|nr:hypothetical protein [Prosthecomicrobium pneumaticum]MBB5754345.1 hypothetical protein [Prosthecomicrobium pneumaticum]
MSIHWRPNQISPATRRAIEDEIERLIALLDQADGDTDLEPYLAATGCEVSRGAYSTSRDDRENDADFEEGADRERDPAEDGLADQDALDLFRSD